MKSKASAHWDVGITLFSTRSLPFDVRRLKWSLPLIHIELDLRKFEDEFRRFALQIERALYRHLRRNIKATIVPYMQLVTPVRTGELRNSIRLRFRSRAGRGATAEITWGAYYAAFPNVIASINRMLDDTHLENLFSGAVLDAFDAALNEILPNAQISINILSLVRIKRRIRY